MTTNPSHEERRRPTRAELRAAAGKTVPDVIGPGLKILFCGINPGLYTAAIGHHFGRPGNRFWPAIHLAGYTPRLLSPYEEQELLMWGWGITNMVARATATSAELGVEEYRAGRAVLEEKTGRYKPEILAVLGVGAYRAAFELPKAGLGRQAERIGGAQVWVLPNPSGLNAHFSLADLAELYAQPRLSLEA